MGKLQPAGYYDAIYADPKYGYQNHWSKSHYRRLWAFVIGAISAMLHGKEKPYILELGCGPGQFATMLFEKLGGADKFYRYKGLDFSSEAIKIAESLFMRERFPEPLFAEANCLDPITYQKHDFKDASIIIAMEIFEHTDDIFIISNLPAGKEIIVTVPDFDDPAHIRHFKSEEEVRNRYSKSIEIGKVIKFERWYVFTGTTK